VANLLTTAGAHRVLTLDLHAAQIQGFFDIPVDNLFAAPVFHKDIAESGLPSDKLTIVSPDVGGVLRARAIAKRLDADLAIVDKRRERAGVSEVMHIIGDVEGRHCILADDIVDSGGTLCNAALALKEQGASSVSAYATHGVFSNNAVDRINKSPLDSMVVTDSIRGTDDVLGSGKVRQLPIANLLGEAIARISNASSVSSLFEYEGME
jgi:ribose-phosphate pyrophosphokinase